MVIEIDSGVWIESDDLSSVSLQPTGAVVVVSGAVAYNVTRFSFEQMLQMLRDREYAATELAY